MRGSVTTSPHLQCKDTSHQSVIKDRKSCGSASSCAKDRRPSQNGQNSGTVTFTKTVDTPVFTHDEKKGNLQLDSYATYLAGTADFDYFVVTLYEADSNVEMGNKVALNTNGSDMAAWDVPSGKYYFRFEKPRNGLDLKVKYEVYPYNG
ncbi:hypothetical protein GCM10007416_34690 [Kroppenstedtia guangzhouensis]|uniref:Pre-peptidase C-terminal domain-containing protein n=1 Tax=Kroppenstedtia guangzhouensis TaxID=1274356 RepID=A0ABQ1H4K0_9BACL|nr:hypothetical protein GCM10007416_34690 [Kroppenstedtia guangzhouensis]